MTDAAYEPWLTRWRLTPDGAPFVTRIGSRLMPVRFEGEPAMLKVAEAGSEEEAGGKLMAWWAGLGAARVLAIEGSALVLERLDGPRSLAEMARGGADDAATRIICETAVSLHAPRAAPPPASLVPLRRWYRALPAAAARLGGLWAEAWAVAEPMLDAQQDIAVLHGDLHHENVLDGGERGWLVIDPKGVLGECGFDYANLFRNPDADTALTPGRLARRARIVAEAARLEPRRLLAWVFTYAVLGAAWSLEDGQEADARVGLRIGEMARAEMAR
ncbi:MAG TPA: aminoglycoside phosphotransferase family protein [Caulobacteraceae bacterium]|nr:aminoglycoside phosphotransferase family protein [Caulobacteraceae bacterium]